MVGNVVETCDVLALFLYLPGKLLTSAPCGFNVARASMMSSVLSSFKYFMCGKLE